jgi:hypothetical protein
VQIVEDFRATLREGIACGMFPEPEDLASCTGLSIKGSKVTRLRLSAAAAAAVISQGLQDMLAGQ